MLFAKGNSIDTLVTACNIMFAGDVDGISSSFLQAVISKGIAAIANQIECLRLIMKSFLKLFCKFRFGESR